MGRALESGYGLELWEEGKGAPPEGTAQVGAGRWAVPELGRRWARLGVGRECG